MRIAVLVSLFTASGFFLAGKLSLPDALFLSVLIVVLPGWAIGQQRIAGVAIIARKQAYLTSGMAIMCLGCVSLVLGVGLDGTGSLVHYLQSEDWFREILLALTLTGVGIAILLTFSLLRRHLGISETEITTYLIPVTKKEKVFFGLLSVCAGFGEEVAFRAYAVPTVIEVGCPPLVAVMLTSIAFGMVHSYQGFLGVVRAGTFGILMGSTLLYTGSLWGLILAHTAIDLLVGLVFSEKFID